MTDSKPDLPIGKLGTCLKANQKYRPLSLPLKQKQKNSQLCAIRHTDSIFTNFPKGNVNATGTVNLLGFIIAIPVLNNYVAYRYLKM